MLDKDPYEVFAIKNYNVEATKGFLTKLKRGLYKAELENNVIIESITELSSHEEDSLTRMTSTALRHGADINFVVHQLEKVKGDMTSFAKSLARALKKYI